MYSTTLRERYDAEARTYDRTRYNTRSGRRYEKARTRIIDSQLPRQGRFLDIAVGTGRSSEGLGRRFVGVDFSMEMMLRGRNRPPLVQADAFWLPFADLVFSGAICCRLMQMIPINRYLAFGAEAVRVLAPGAPLVVELWHTDDPYDCRRLNSWGLYDTFVHPSHLPDLFRPWMRWIYQSGRFNETGSFIAVYQESP